MILFIIIFVVGFLLSFAWTGGPSETTAGWIKRFLTVSVIAAALTWLALTVSASDEKARVENAKNLKDWNANMREKGCYISSYAGKDGEVPLWTCPGQKDVIRGYY